MKWGGRRRGKAGSTLEGSEFRHQNPLATALCHRDLRHNGVVPTYRLIVEFEGTRYKGWQDQPGVRTVAGELRRVLTQVGLRVVDFGGAGRTDAGVHALAQVAHLRLGRSVDPVDLRRRANDLLPADIHILALDPAAEDFHSRRQAVLRSYLYQVALRRTAFAKRFVWWPRPVPEVDRVQQALALVPGRHDFAAFCENPDAQTSTIVVVERAETALDGGLLLIRLAASHFLWKMVRRIVGAAVRVGQGQLRLEEFGAFVSGNAEGNTAAWTAPPSGLFLESVLYQADAFPGALIPAIPVRGEPSPGTSPTVGFRGPGEGKRGRKKRENPRRGFEAGRREG